MRRPTTFAKTVSFLSRITRIEVFALTMVTVAGQALATVDQTLPDEVCKAVRERPDEKCSDLTEAATNASYVDLDGDGTAELVLTHGGGSCGSIYWVFRLESGSMPWKRLGSWCGCEWSED